jgi:hypothetical protein
MGSKKAIVESFFRDISKSGLEQAIRDYGREQFSWWICE